MRLRTLEGVAWACLIVSAASCFAIVRGVRTHRPTVPPNVVSDSVPPYAAAITECRKGKATIVIPRYDTLPPLVLEELLVHEGTHVRQFESDPRLTCEQAEAIILNNRDLLLNSEAEAYCADATWAGRVLGIDPLAKLIDEAVGQAMLFNSMGDPKWMVPTRDVIALFIRSCPAVARSRT